MVVVTEATRTRLRGLDPVGPALAVLAALIYVVRGFDGYLSRDLALYAYAGQRFADGVLPYEGVLNRSGPLSHAVPGVPLLVTHPLGIDDVLAMRVWCLVLAAAAVWVAYLLGRDLWGSRLTGIGTAVALLSITGFDVYATSGPREKTVLVLFLLAAGVAVARLRPGWAGLFVSLATLTWQPALFPGAATALVGLWALPAGTRGRGFARFALTGLAPLAALLVLYAATGHLRRFLDCFVLIHARYTQQPGLEASWPQMSKDLGAVYRYSLVVLVVGAVALLAAAVRAAGSAELRADRAQRLVVANAVGLVVGGLWCFKAFNGWPDLFFLFPQLVVGIGCLVVLLRRFPARVAVAGTAAWAVVGAGYCLHYSLTEGTSVLPAQRRSVDVVSSALPADATYVSIEAPQPLVLTHSVDPFPVQMFSQGFDDYVDATWPGGLAGLADDIGAADPTVIAVGTLDPTWLDPLLHERYVDVGYVPGWHWWINRDVGTATLTRLQEELQAETP